MTRSPRELRGFFYSVKSLIEGFIRMIECSAMDPDDIESAFFETIMKEQAKLNKERNPET